jgi:alginate O-acetyltransferase complex protein AlgI
MAFNSYEFLFAFLPLAVTGYWLIVRASRPAAAPQWLLLVSVAFYVYASPVSLAVLAPSILLDYVIASMLLRFDETRVRARAFLFAFGVLANIAFLGYFKYKNFFLDISNSALGTEFTLSALALPLGISFVTFQKIAFLADVHARHVRAVGFLDYLLFVLFFPRAIAGPIIRYQEVVPQFSTVARQDHIRNVAVGLCLFFIGLFKKVVIADNIAKFVPAAFDTALTGDPPPGLLTAWTGVFAYAFQLYFDFSGYSDMALGVARIFGVRLPMNFNSPFKATSIIDFWARWHITLTRFLTAYVYTPIVLRATRARMAEGKAVLRGKRTEFSAIWALIAVPTLMTMALSGLWHGAGWQFVAWGVLHGVYLTINQGWRIIRPRFWPDHATYQRIMAPVGWFLTFTSVLIGLVFFRANSLESAWSILGSMVGRHGTLPLYAQVVGEVGVTLPWSILTLLQPIAPFVWISVLLLSVMLLPNSLELLRRYEPALDFPEPGSAPGTTLEAGAKLSEWRVKLARLRYRGIELNPLTAAVMAVISALGVMALSRGGAFLYGQF